jgi:sensor histidine kinase YesM
MNRVTLLFDSFFTKRRWIAHVFFWSLILSFYVLFFGRRTENYSLTLFFVGLLMPVTIGTTYFVNYVLIPRYLMGDRYGLFVSYFIYTLLGSVFLETVIALLTFIIMAELSIKSMSPASIDIIFLLTSLLLVIFFASGIKMLLHWKKSKEDYQQLMREKVETELKFLKTQLNPHFLFNTLNNLYYLATIKSDKAAEAILCLSDMLDYILKEGKAAVVPLDRELKHLRNYVDLELLRFEDRADVKIDVLGKPETHTIGPMMLITLMENSFKHGLTKTAQNQWIHMTVRCTDEHVNISIVNGRKDTINGHGIGMENLHSQLKHLFGERFQLKIEDDVPEKFGINLTILKENK